VRGALDAAWLRLTAGDEAPIVPRSGAASALTAMAAAAMGFLAVLTLCAGIAADRLAANWRADLAGIATVRVTAPAAELEARITATLVVLGTTPGIGAVRLLTDAEHEALLEPWLGQGDWMAELPVPRLIELRFDGPGPDPASLQARLDEAAPGTVYDDHAAWRAPLAKAATALKRLAWVATGLVALAAAATIALAARSTVAVNAEVVRVIRLIGGEDRFIEQAFVRRMTARAALGGLAGTCAGVITVALMPALAPGTPLALSLGPTGWGWLGLLAGVPAAAGLIASVASRHAVRLVLRRTA